MAQNWSNPDCTDFVFVDAANTTDKQMSVSMTGKVNSTACSLLAYATASFGEQCNTLPLLYLRKSTKNHKSRGPVPLKFQRFYCKRCQFVMGPTKAYDLKTFFWPINFDIELVNSSFISSWA